MATRYNSQDFGICYPDKQTLPSLEELRMTLENCGSSLTASDFKRLIDFLEGLNAARFGLFMGLAATDTNPADDERVPVNDYGWYLASSEGTYTHFKDSTHTAISISENERDGKLVFLLWNKCDGYWEKVSYTITDFFNRRAYELSATPSYISLYFAKDNQIGNGGVPFDITVVSKYKTLPTAYLSENHIPSWIKYRGVTTTETGVYVHHFFACENKGAERCADIQFVQTGSNNIETARVCQNSNNLWMYEFNIEGQVYHNAPFFKEAYSRAFLQHSYKNSDYINWKVNNIFPAWMNVRRYNRYVIVTTMPNMDNVPRKYTVEFKQDESDKKDYLIVEQSHYASLDAYRFLINQKPEETVDFSTSASQTVVEIESLKNNLLIGYDVLNDIPEWLTLELFGDYILVKAAKNPDDTDRLAEVILQQKESNNIVLLNVHQSVDCEFMPNTNPIYRKLDHKTGCSKYPAYYETSLKPFENKYFVITELDINPNSPTYNQEIVTRVPENDAACMYTAPYYEYTGRRDCSSSATEYIQDSTGGFAWRERIDINDLSATYNQTSWVRDSANDGICPYVDGSPNWQFIGNALCSPDDNLNE